MTLDQNDTDITKQLSLGTFEIGSQEAMRDAIFLAGAHGISTPFNNIAGNKFSNTHDSDSNDKEALVGALIHSNIANAARIAELKEEIKEIDKEIATKKTELKDIKQRLEASQEHATVIKKDLGAATKRLEVAEEELEVSKEKEVDAVNEQTQAIEARSDVLGVQYGIDENDELYVVDENGRREPSLIESSAYHMGRATDTIPEAQNIQRINEQCSIAHKEVTVCELNASKERRCCDGLKEDLKTAEKETSNIQQEETRTRGAIKGLEETKEKYEEKLTELQKQELDTDIQGLHEDLANLEDNDNHDHTEHDHGEIAPAGFDPTLDSTMAAIKGLVATGELTQESLSTQLAGLAPDLARKVQFQIDTQNIQTNDPVILGGIGHELAIAPPIENPETIQEIAIAAHDAGNPSPMVGIFNTAGIGPSAPAPELASKIEPSAPEFDTNFNLSA